MISAIVGFTCAFRVAKGEKYNPMLKLNTSMVFREKERKYKNIVSAENQSLIQRVDCHLKRRKTLEGNI